MAHLAILGAIASLFICAGLLKPEAHGATPSPAATPSSEGTIVALGDSLTAGYGVNKEEAYPAQLEKRLHSAGYRWHVINAGISGETSTGALARLDSILRLRPDIVIVETGANDGLRGTNPQILKKNLEQIVQTLKEKKITVVLAGMKMFSYLGKNYTEAFYSVYSDLARHHDLILVPFFLEGVAGQVALNQGDRIHPLPQGYRVVTDTVYPYVAQAIKRAKVEH
ncbi:arylesterase [Geomonas sp. RF6]|uniref:arylesterase n=1 Tax=Geomonas sp. RF6 TaxID=2897342 RepID=UPI001E63A051|nr:arylesterase [Geomonas sp. RF6]UFS70030.1 arylesterase [Geomonas sp. RF6]